MTKLFATLFVACGILTACSKVTDAQKEADRFHDFCNKRTIKCKDIGDLMQLAN